MAAPVSAQCRPAERWLSTGGCHKSLIQKNPDFMTSGPWRSCFGVVDYQHTNSRGPAMKTLTDFYRLFPSRPVPAVDAVRPAPAPAVYVVVPDEPARNAPRYRSRDFGTG